MSNGENKGSSNGFRACIGMEEAFYLPLLD